MKERLIQLGHGITELRQDLAELDLITAEKRELLGRIESEFAEILGGTVGTVDENAAPDADVPQPASVVSGVEKRGALQWLLERNPDALIVLDATHTGVRVPPKFAKATRLGLRFGYNMQPPIPDFRFTDEHVEGTLTFNGVPFHCVVPWDAVLGFGGQAPEAPTPPTNKRGHLSLVPMPEGERPAITPPSDGTHLRLVPMHSEDDVDVVVESLSIGEGAQDDPGPGAA